MSKKSKLQKSLKVTKELKHPEDDQDIVTLLSPDSDNFKSTESITELELYPEKRDPVIAARRQERRLAKVEDLPIAKVHDGPIEPSVSFRLALDKKPTIDVCQPKPKYIAPEKKAWKEAKAKKKEEFLESLNFCEFDVMKLPSPTDGKSIPVKLEVPSPETSRAKVIPRKPSYDKDAEYPEPQEKEELEVKKPKSGIFINVKSHECLEDDDEPPSKTVKRFKKKKSLPQAEEDFDEKSDIAFAQFDEGEGEWMEEDMYFDVGSTKATEMSDEIILTKYRKKVSQISVATEINKYDLVAENVSWEQIPVISKIVQTMRLDQEAQRPKKKLKHGTLESHSFTKLKQFIPEKFCFKVVAGSIHTADKNFSELSRGNQGICMAVAAFCYSEIKHPKNWNSLTIDDVVELGDQFFHQSIATLHMHNHKKDLQAKQLQKYVIIDDKKVRYHIEEPEIVGHIRATDRRIYNLSKGLRIFFNRRKAGILVTEDLTVCIWKPTKKYIYMFDATPRAKDLYQDPKGTAVLAKFKKPIGVAAILLDRTDLDNSVFSISEISIIKIVHKDDVDDDVPVEESSRYNIINENKAVVKGTFDLSDKCFGFSRNKQAMAMSCVALVYSRITPPNSWHRKTVDKIMIIGNQLFLECQKTERIADMKLEHMPALFTIGPYIVNIYIFANRYVDLLIKKGQNCLLIALEDFFQTCTNSVTEVGNTTLAIWKQRNMFYMFDPYSRNMEGLNCRSGTACVSMYSELNALCETVAKNYPDEDVIFRIHPLKVLKIHRDSAMNRQFPPTMQMKDFSIQKFKCQKIKKSKKKAIEKPITVHLPGCAMKKLVAGESPGASMISIASNVDSILGDILPKLPVIPPKPLPKTKINELGLVADLDSPSLSDTQIEPPRPKPFGDDEIYLMDLDSFKLTEEEKEMLSKDEGEEGEMGGGDAAEHLESYLALSQRNQVHSGSLAPCFAAAQTITDLTYKYKILPALEFPLKLKKAEDKPMLDYHCQRKAFENRRNYKDVAEGAQVLTGDKNIFEFTHDYDMADRFAPYVAIMACAFGNEFPPSKWHSKCVDFIMKAAFELFEHCKEAYYKIEEFKIRFLKHEYRVTVENVFDTYLGKDIFTSYQGHKIIEQYIEEELLQRNSCGFILTPDYVTAIMLYNNLYYLYDPYMCNKKGECVCDEENGTAAVQRFKTLAGLVFRFVSNRLANLGENKFEYIRLVLAKPKFEKVWPEPSDRKELSIKEVEEEVEITKSKELAKPSNFVELPDNTEIVRGTTNVSNFGEEVEYIAPFVCIMAAVVGQKYNVLTWSSDVVDFIIKCGSDLYKESKVRFDQVPKLEIPKVSLGKDNYKLSVNYLYDAVMKMKILEKTLGKILYQECDWGILVTQNYSCAVFFNNYLYYMFDCFACNEVGLGDGLKNKGFGCISRFKDLHSLAFRIMTNKNKRESPDQIEYTRFVVSLCKVKKILPPKIKPKIEEFGEYEDFEMEEDEEEEAAEDEAPLQRRNRIGYHWTNGRQIMEGTKALHNRAAITGELKPDHFVSLCAGLMVINIPLKKWDTKRVDAVLDIGVHIFSHAKNLEISSKRSVKNILLGKYFFDVMIKRIVIPTWRKNKNLSVGLNTVLEQRNICIVQFPNCSYVVYKDEDGFHLFDPYGPPLPPKTKKKDGDDGPKAAWLRFATDKQMKKQIVRNLVKNAESYTFYTFCVLNIRPAPKKAQVTQKLTLFEEMKKRGQEIIGKPFFEHESWLDIHQSPWSRSKDETACGKARASKASKWHDWDIEYPNDLYSLCSSIHQMSRRFSRETRGKQTLANLVVAIGMTNVYEFPEWNVHIMDAILVNGDLYFKHCIEDISEPNHEITMEDLKSDCSIFPYTFQVNFSPIVQGTMFLESYRKFNLYKALRSFFDNYESRCGIIVCTKGETKKHIGFGKIQEMEYFLYDCQSFGPPMFWEREGMSYILRCTTLNRLLHALVITLKGGDFFVYEVETYNFQPIEEKKDE